MIFLLSKFSTYIIIWRQLKDEQLVFYIVWGREGAYAKQHKQVLYATLSFHQLGQLQNITYTIWILSRKWKTHESSHDKNSHISLVIVIT